LEIKALLGFEYYVLHLLFDCFQRALLHLQLRKFAVMSLKGQTALISYPLAGCNALEVEKAQYVELIQKFWRQYQGSTLLTQDRHIAVFAVLKRF
jgi:hypothetical protein